MHEIYAQCVTWLFSFLFVTFPNNVFCDTCNECLRLKNKSKVTLSAKKRFIKLLCAFFQLCHYVIIDHSRLCYLTKLDIFLVFN